MQLWIVEHVFLHKKVPVIMNSELHFSEETSFKIHTLVFLIKNDSYFLSLFK